MKAEDLWSLPQMAWTVVSGSPLSLYGLGVHNVFCIILEGVPRWERRSCERGAVLPR